MIACVPITCCKTHQIALFVCYIVIMSRINLIVDDLFAGLSWVPSQFPTLISRSRFPSLSLSLSLPLYMTIFIIEGYEETFLIHTSLGVTYWSHVTSSLQVKMSCHNWIVVERGLYLIIHGGKKVNYLSWQLTKEIWTLKSCWILQQLWLWC